jgi:hypothetical protein
MREPGRFVCSERSCHLLRGATHLHALGVDGAGHVLRGDRVPRLLSLTPVVPHSDVADDRPLDRPRVPAGHRALLVESPSGVADLLERPEGVPHVGMPGRDAEQSSPAHAPDDDGQARLDRPRPDAHPLHPIEAACVIDDLAVEQAPDEDRGLLEALHPVPHLSELQAVRPVLELVVARAEAQDGATVGHVVEGHGHLRNEPGIAERG